MAELNFPSMFDTRQAMDRQMQEDAHKAAVAGGGSKRYECITTHPCLEIKILPERGAY